MNKNTVFVYIQDWFKREGITPPRSHFENVYGSFPVTRPEKARSIIDRFLIDLSSEFGVDIDYEYFSDTGTFNDLMNYIQFLEKFSYEPTNRYVPRYRNHHRY